MSKARIVAVAAVALLVAVSGAHAQPNVSFGLTAGAAIPVSDYGNAYKTGFMGGVMADLWVAPTWAIGVDVAGDFHNAKDAENAYFTEVSDALGGTSDVTLKNSVIQYTAHLKWHMVVPGSPVAPFVQGGAGGYTARAKLDGGVFNGENNTSTKFGWNVGAGVDLWSTPAMSLGVAGNFHDITDAFTDEHGDKKGVEYVTVGATLTFSTSGGTH